MTRIIYKIFIFSITILLGAAIYLSTIGIKTNKFNSKIISQIKQIDKNLDIKNLMFFIRLVNKNPKIFIAEQFIKKGYVIADIKIE